MYIVAAAALLLGAGCKKALNPSSVQLTGSAKGLQSGLPNFPMSSPGARLVSFDLATGTGMSYILAYDCNNSTTPMVYNIKGTSMPSYTFTINGSPYYGFTAATNNYTEFGGTHITAFDMNSTGHLDHLLMYEPGTGEVQVLEHSSTGTPGDWNVIWDSHGGGIGGYDLHGTTDKIIAYDFGSGYMSSVICYRPGNGYCWVILNEPTSTANPNWVAVDFGSSGIGGFDLKGVNDQIVPLFDEAGWMDLVCYRPGYGYVWYLEHPPYYDYFEADWTSRSGIPGILDFSQVQDRMVPWSGNNLYYGNYLLCYRPGNGGTVKSVYFTYNGVYVGPTTGPSWVSNSGFLTYPMQYNGQSGPSYIGDKIISFDGSGMGQSSMACYAGGANQVALIEEGPVFSWSDAY